MLGDSEIYNSIVREFQLSSSTLEQMKEIVDALIKSRMDICKLLKISKFKAETLDVNEKEFIRNIDINKSNIKNYEKKQIELIDKIKVNKQEIKVIRLHINKLEEKIIQEQQESRELREALRIFFSREKFKFIKRLLVRKYRRVFLKYSNELSIKSQIKECNIRKEKIREEKQIFIKSIDSYNRKIIASKIALAQMRKNIINMQKCIEFLNTKLQSLKDYKETEKEFRVQAHKYERLNDKK
jgi:hypothetical protein